MVDMHIHTNYSDGEDDCLTLINKLKEKQITIFSVTDHDTIDGNIEISATNLNGLKFITGVEVSSIFKGIKCHLLGYDFDINHPAIKELMKTAKENRQKKIDVVLEYLDKTFNITFTESEVSYLRQLPNCGRPHFAKILVSKGYGKTIKEIFDTYLNNFSSPDLKIQVDEVIKSIKQAGGLVSLAHPIEIIHENKINEKELKIFIEELKDLGLDAIECYHSSHNDYLIKQYLEIAETLGLAISGGSDYHGSAKPDVRLGEPKLTLNQLTIFKLFRGTKYD